MIEFHVCAPKSAAGNATVPFDSLESAHAYAARLRKGGISCYVEMRERPDPQAEFSSLSTVIEVLDRPRCRQIRWAGVAP